ncbi:N-acetylmuramoyl-L-alanine amidase [Planctomycetota bacterium]|nr:N-acetylmuramoyl-L-alanine amidase [Planctomycetota bacterium]
MLHPKIVRRAASLALGLAVATSITTSAHAVTYPWDKINFDLAAEGNYSETNISANIDSIVIHTVEGSYNGCISWFNNPNQGYYDSKGNWVDINVSAHYVMSQDGTGTQMVSSWKTAHHATYYNSRSIGFEMAGYAGQASTWFYQPSDSEFGTTYKNYKPNLDTLANVCAYFVETYDIPVVHPEVNAYDFYNNRLNVSGFVAHSQVQPWNKGDPGPHFPWDDFMLMVQSYVDHDKNIYWPEVIEVPEPTTASMIGIAGLALIARRRRK